MINNRLFSYLTCQRRLIALILLLNCFIALLGVVNPYLTKLIIDKAYARRDPGLFITLTLIAGAIFVIGAVINGVSHYLNNSLRLSVVFNLQRKIFAKLQSLPYSFFQDSSTGENLFKINYDIEQSAGLISGLLPQAVFLVPKSLLALLVIFYLDWKISLLAISLGSLCYIFPAYFNKRYREVIKKCVEHSEYLFSRLQEFLSHMHLIKAFGREKAQERRYTRDLIKNTRLSLTSARLEEQYLFVNTLTNRLAVGLVLVYGGLGVINGRVTLGTLTAITIYLGQLSGLQDSLLHFFRLFSSAIVSFNRLEGILDFPSEPLEHKDSKAILLSKAAIEFKQVTFGYTQELPVLKGLSFRIEGGSCVGVVGPSGCGKTTLINLIARMYRPSKGQVFLDGNDIYYFKAGSLYEQVSVVLQESLLWNAKIRENIAFIDERASVEKVIAAARIAQAHEFIMRFPQGYETSVGEYACKISEGQKQRIAIARAVLKEPKILILDEAMSSLDSETEDKIIDNIMQEFAGMTIIVVSHRLSTVRKMQKVYFLESPGQMDVGAHEELFAGNNRYRQLFASQAQEQENLAPKNAS